MEFDDLPKEELKNLIFVETETFQARMNNVHELSQ